MTIVDLFAGAGGLSEGFIQEGFTPLAHVEEDAAACRTLQTRMAYYYFRARGEEQKYNDYALGKTGRSDFLSLVPEELKNGVLQATICEQTVDQLISTVGARVATAGIRRLDVLLGAAPCQAYSLIGRSATREKCPDDPRLGLYKFYIKFLSRLTPTFFVFENVPGILSVDRGHIFARLKAGLEDAGYHVEHRIVDAVRHGVLQKRRRVVVFGWRKRLHIDLPQFAHWDMGKSIVSNVLDDLPSVNPGTDGSNTGYTSRRNKYLETTQLRRDEDVLTLHIARPHNEADRGIYSHMIQSWTEDRKRLRYQHLPAHLRTRSNITTFTDRYKLVARELPYSHTVLAHIAKDGHYYIHPDGLQRRSITVREAARLQSFPDSYFFEGSRSSMFRQIGNAVPPLLSRAVAAAVRRVIA